MPRAHLTSPWMGEVDPRSGLQTGRILKGDKPVDFAGSASDQN